jgi:hypothetical protein
MEELGTGALQNFASNSQTAPPSAYQVPPMQPVGAPLIVGWAGRQEGARFLDTVCL